MKVEGLITTVDFAEDKNNAKIALTAKDNQLILQDINVEGLRVGIDHPTEEQTNELPKIIMNFNTIESVDTLIDMLKHIRDNLEPWNYTNYFLAC